jgi:glyoxylase-like metal-dependent hydrolase (beta-lactamase superfamily II)/rhodanese-related sulfurtransferase
VTHASEEAGMDVHPIVDEGLGNAAWLVDLGDGRALVVDPARDPTPYLELARRRRLRIAWAAETHLHADFLTGTRELAAACGTRVLAPRASRLAFDHHGLDDDQEVDLGGLALRTVATPGHAPEHLAYLLADGGRPLAVFSGGALLVGGVARTDLVAAEQTVPLARAAWRSVHEPLLGLPDELAVYPTHGAGSFCAAPSPGGRRATTIGAERAANPLLAAPDADTFVARLLGGLGSFPPYFLRLRARNRAGPALLGPNWHVMPTLPPQQVQELVAGGAVLVDARPIDHFAAGHVAGALSIALRPQFATWLGWLVDDAQPLVVVLDHDQDRTELARQCRTIGYDRLAGELGGGMAAWRAAGLPERRTPLVSAERLGDDPGTVLDVRQASELAEGHLPGAVTIELGVLAARARDPALAPEPVTVMCGHGERAMTAASLLERAAGRGVRVLRGGAAGWQAATGRPLARS